MLSPFLIAERYILPSLRRALVAELYKKGMTEAEIAEALGISISATSRYLHGKRGALLDVDTNSDIAAKIKNVAVFISSNKKGKVSNFEVEEALHMLTSEFMSKGYFCEIHKSIDSSLKEIPCNLCSKIFSLEKTHPKIKL